MKIEDRWRDRWTLWNSDERLVLPDVRCIVNADPGDEDRTLTNDDLVAALRYMFFGAKR